MPSKKHIPTDKEREQVRSMAGFGLPEDKIAIVIGIAPKTLRKYYRRELDKAHIEATATVAGALFKNAKDGNVTAQIFWMKTRGGWREQPQEHRHGGVVGTYDLTKVSDSELARLEEILTKASVANGPVAGGGASGESPPDSGGGEAQGPVAD